MSWLDTLLDRGLEAMQPAQEIALAPEPQPEPEIKCAWFQTRGPQNGDLGEVYPAYYSVADGVLTIHDESGKPLATPDEIEQLRFKERQKYRLRSGEDPHQAAGRLGRKAWIAARGESDFNRAISYGPLGNA